MGLNLGPLEDSGKMAKHNLNKLSARKIATTTAPGRYSDGGGLYLVITPTSRKWVFIFTLAGKRREMGLGPLRQVSLPTARDLAAKAREHLRASLDPIVERKRLRQAVLGVPTFGEIADSLIESIEHRFRNPKHRAQWRMTLTKYAASLRKKRVDEITTTDVLEVLQPIWSVKGETASRLRSRIERVLDAARVQGHRSGENPARWRGHLEAILPKPSKLTRGHHAAMAFDEVPQFIERLRKIQSLGALALEFLVLTAARSGEVFAARRSEFDFKAKVWTVPGSRMKSGREHRVPLSDRASEIIRGISDKHSGQFIFPGVRPGAHLSSMTLAMVLRRMDLDCTVHGFRSAFRDWVGERTNFPREVAEAALAHVVGDATERAYRRGDALEKRRELMKEWAAFCEPKAANVVSMAWAS
jgi:integrase